uniref:Uncharacterized protein n=1 Tax=Clastoptera arizonana TaxID=38151 RepID=A0A1B6CKN0_9HEMI
MKFQELLQQYAQSSQAEKTKLEEINEVLRNQINRLECELKAANESILKKEENLRLWQEKYDEQSKKCNKAIDELSKTWDKLGCTEKELNNLKKTVDSISKKYQEKLSDNILLQQLDQLSKKNQNIILNKNNIIKKNEAQIEDLKQEIVKLKSKSDSPERLRNDLKISQIQTHETGETLIAKDKQYEAENKRLLQKIEEYKNATIELKTKNKQLEKKIGEISSKINISDIGNRLKNVEENLNGLKIALKKLKDSDELESKKLHEEIVKPVQTLQEVHSEADRQLLKRNKNLEQILEMLNKLLNQCSQNISEIHKGLESTEEAHCELISLSTCEYEGLNYTTMPSEAVLYYVGKKIESTSEVEHTISDVRSNEPSENTVIIQKSHESESSLRPTEKEKDCTCKKLESLIIKKDKQKKTIPNLSNLNNKLLDLLYRMNSILNTINELENSILFLHEKIHYYCKCDELSEEGRIAFDNVENNLNKINELVSQTEEDFKNIENENEHILKQFNSSDEHKHSSQILLDSSRILIAELFQEIILRKERIRKKFNIVQQECYNLTKVINESQQSSFDSIETNLECLPSSIQNFYPIYRQDSNTFLIYVPPDGGCKCNSCKKPSVNMLK